MSDDDLLDRLKRDWRAQPACPPDRNATAGSRGFGRRAVTSATIGAAVILACGTWSTIAALRTGDPLYAIASIAYAAALPVILSSAVTAARFRAEITAAPLELAERTAARAALSLRLLSGARACSLILAVAALSAGTVGAPLLAVLWGTTAVLTWAWQTYRRRQLTVQLRRCETMVGELSDAPGAPGAPVHAESR
jgi:hypothetical protein